MQQQVWLPAVCHGIGDKLVLATHSCRLGQGWGLFSSSELGRDTLGPCCLTQGSCYLAAPQLYTAHPMGLSRAWACPVGQEQQGEAASPCPALSLPCSWCPPLVLGQVCVAGRGERPELEHSSALLYTGLVENGDD